MEAGMIITVYLASALVAGIIAGAVAPNKRRHPGYWMIFSFLIPPFVLLLLILPRGHGDHRRGRDPFHDEDDDDNVL